MRLTTVTFNTYCLWDMLVGHSRQYDRVLEFVDLLPADTDVVCLQEFFCGKSALCSADYTPRVDRRMRARGLAHRTAANLPRAPPAGAPFALCAGAVRLVRTRRWGLALMCLAPVTLTVVLLYAIHLTLGDQQHLDGGLVVYSRWPVLEQESHPWKAIREVHAPEHLAAKGFVWTRIRKNGTVVSIVNLHCCSTCAPAVNRLQLAELARFLARRVPPDEPTVIQGDFNIPHRVFASIFPGFRPAHEGEFCTWRKHDRSRCRHLDHVLHNRRFAVAEHRLLAQDRDLSDHVPVAATLVLRER